MRIVYLLAGALLALAACGEKAAVAPAPVAVTIAAVDGAAIEAADDHPGDWLSHGRTYSEQRYSPLEQINLTNIARTGLAWSSDLDADRGMEATPLVVDGVMYVTSAWSMVYALDAKTGERLWRYDPEVDKARGQKACCDVVNRGVAIWKGKVIVGTIDGRLIALDAKSGEPVWSVVTVDQSKPYTITGAPRVVKGKVLIGNGGADYGVRGYITAYDVETGKQAWRFFMTPNPEKKPDGAASDKFFADTGNATWGDAGVWTQSGGGGTAWDAIVYDPKLDIVYVGTGNGSPWNRRMRDPAGGDNLLVSSILALKPETGEYVWHYQTTPGDSWDYTATQPIILADLAISGAVRQVLMQAPKSGFFYVLDRATGELISADKYQDNATWASSVDTTTGRPVEVQGARYETKATPAAPGTFGNHSWHPMAFSPKTGLVYIPVQTIPTTFADAKDYRYRPGFWNTGTDFAALGLRPPAVAALDLKGPSGQLVAWDPISRKARWTVPYPTPWNGGALATAGGLVFQGALDGKFRAFDAATGQQKWEGDADYPVLSGPISYEVDGEQYVAVTAGWGTGLPLAGGTGARPGASVAGRVIAYKLNGSALPPPKAVAPVAVNQKPPAARFGTTANVDRGATLYANNCTVCHGGGGRSSGIIPDVRWSAAGATRASWKEIVIDGARASAGMAGFKGAMSDDDAEAIRAYVVSRAHDSLATPPR